MNNKELETHLALARDHYTKFLAALRAAYTSACHTDDGFAEIVLLSMLESGGKYSHDIARAVTAAKERS
jgi:hypothetical protein